MNIFLNIFLSAMGAALIFCFFMLYRNEVAFKLSTEASRCIYKFNTKQPGPGLRGCILDYDDVLKTYDEIMWDFRVWKVEDAFRTREIYSTIAGV